MPASKRRPSAPEAPPPDALLFFRQWLAHPLRTASASPSSPALARALTASIDPASTGQVVELGPGTGPMTDALVARGVDPARLVLLEYNEVFAGHLARRYPAATVVTGDARNAAALVAPVLTGPIAGVVSSLPVVQWPPATRLAIARDLLELATPGATFSQFTYGPVSPVPVGGGEIRVVSRKRILLNVPPAIAWTYALSPES